MYKCPVECKELKFVYYPSLNVKLTMEEFLDISFLTDDYFFSRIHRFMKLEYEKICVYFFRFARKL